MSTSEAQEAGQILDEEKLAFLADLGIPASQAQTIIPHNAAFQTEDLNTYDSDCDDLLTALAVLMANISNYRSNVISEANVQDINLQAQQDSMILSVIEQMSEQIINHVNNWEKENKEQNNESITAELEKYKERVKTFEQRLNIDLSSHKKMIDSQMNDMIREKLALKEQIDSLEQNLSKQIKEKEFLFKTFTVFKNESKEKENKYMENEIDLEKKIKELDNIGYKVGYQNPFYLRKAQRIKPTLYDGAVISKTHVAMYVINNEETLILEEEIRSKMFEKAKDPEVIAKKISHKPIDYEKLNSLIEDFKTRFSLQQELSAEQAFWFHTYNPTIEPSYSPPVMVDVPSCLDYTLVSGLRMFETHDRESFLAHELWKSKKTSHQPKAEDTNQEKLYLLHMDLCGPMRVASINGKRYILVIVDDYSRFTWVRFLKTKDEAPAAIIKCIKNIQVRLKATVRNVRTDNGTEFVNQTLREWYENVGISHQTSVARTPQQNGVVERRNRTLVEAARTMLIFSKAPLFLWAEAINTACYTQNRSLIRLRYNKTPYELMQDKKPDLSFFHVFGSLCYPTNDHEDLGKFDAKADIGIFVGYAPAKKAFRIYNRRTRQQ
ncbi:retrovirus-related pol polyprotein from transposon TNT 1-94 [Tanacetum coccineum]